MNNKNSLILSLVMVLVVGLSIVAGTFAYFQWQAAVGTQVNVTIEMGGIKMHIEPEQTGFVGLYPTVHCENNVKYGDTLVRIENNTGTLAIPSFKLSVAINPSVADSGQLDYYKEHVHYAVVALETTKDGSGNPVKGNPVGGNIIDNLVTGTCKLPLTVSTTEDNDNTFRTDYGKSATGLFNVITEENVFADTPMLPREYNSTTGEVQGVTFRGEAYSTSYQYYRVYVWVDEGYTSTIVGNNVTDPLQNATIQVTWSENSMLQQVSGVSNVEEDIGLEPGYYENGVMVKTWNELLDDGDITVVDNVITNSNKTTLTGDLVMAEGITSIGGHAFETSHLTSIKIASSVTTIEDYAFQDSYLKVVSFAPNSQVTEFNRTIFRRADITSIEIPAMVTFISNYEFVDCTSLEQIKFEGTVEQWNELNKQTGWNSSVPAVEVICSNGVVTLREEGLYTSDSYILWNTLMQDEDITIDNEVITESNSELSGYLVIPEGIVGINSWAFATGGNGTSLNSIYIPSTVTFIGSEAFYESSLTNVYFSANSQLASIAEYAFWRCNLNHVEIPASVESIRQGAFDESGLSSVTFALGSQLKTIGQYAFSNNDISSIEIPSSVTEIGNSVFSNCSNLFVITFKGTKAQWNAINKDAGWNSNSSITKIICTDGEVAI